MKRFLILLITIGFITAMVIAVIEENNTMGSRKIPETYGIFQYNPWIVTIPFEEKYQLAANGGELIIIPTWVDQDTVNLGEFEGPIGIDGKIIIKNPQQNYQMVIGEVLKIDPEKGPTILFYYRPPPGHGKVTPFTGYD